MATFGYFTHLVVAGFGFDWPWVVHAGLAIALTAILGYRRVDLSARVLGVLVAAELAVLVVLDASMVGRHGGAAFPLAAFDLAGIGQGALGLGLMFAFTSFLGFEAAALYGEESRNPKRTVPVATYCSIAVVAIFYGLTSWITVGALGLDNVRQEAAHKLGDLIIDLTADHLGAAAAALLSVLLLTSLFATLVATHNSTNRLAFALGREGVLPRSLGRVHVVHQSPARASAFQSAFNATVIAIFAIAGMDPYRTLAVSMSGLGTLGLVSLQAVTAFAVVGYFRGRRDRRWWRTALAPALGGIGLTAAVVLIIAHYPSLTGVGNPVVNSLPLVLVAAAAVGAGYALWLRRAHPDVYAAIGADASHDEPTAGPENPAPQSNPIRSGDQK